jgi:hypothetical protein
MCAKLKENMYAKQKKQHKNVRKTKQKIKNFEMSLLCHRS